MRPIGSTKERLPIYNMTFNTLICQLKMDKHISDETKNKLIQAYTLLYYTGCRVSEIAKLDVSDIKNIIALKTLALNGQTKTKRPRTIHFTDRMIAIIKDFKLDNATKHGDYLFYQNGTNYPMDKKGLTKLLNNYLMAYLKTDLYTTHSFRAGYITRIVESTGNIRTACDMVGHRNVTTTLRYIATSKEQKLDALAKVFG
ncbi:recombinase [Campylobacter pinnipediorum subsp. caledonicus]|uniref:Recombinase n=1 Tax=Campylobacter pinnipediorum subsp. caledonicus TaxID=1874362 RepID=A0A1S6U5V5_9BACT|nr:site-specific integrase [Campylobacter pinnipediorum]AQW87114.1 recombinase [Campylobacter pinnipediorum subsp. caledonicus]